MWNIYNNDVGGCACANTLTELMVACCGNL